MKKHFFLCLFSSILFGCVYGNDGAFYAKGNQLVPIRESDISVKKEILSVKKVGNDYFEITVYYEFFNPGNEKTITVGFEAFSPYGDVNPTPKFGQHPYMRDFTVELNRKILNYNVAIVTDSVFIKNGEINRTKEDVNGMLLRNNNFNYVYYFDAKFEKGLNIVRHTYNFDISNSIGVLYEFEYNLTAAKRWANKQIDDFTLILDLGECEDFIIDQTFFNSKENWILNGIGKLMDFNPSEDDFYQRNGLECVIQKGFLIYQKNDFEIDGDLFIRSVMSLPVELKNPRDLPYSYWSTSYLGEPETDFERRVLRNLPFARRGYVFKNKDLQEYFERTTWYIANPNYSQNVDLLHDNEKLEYERWKKQ